MLNSIFKQTKLVPEILQYKHQVHTKLTFNVRRNSTIYGY